MPFTQSEIQELAKEISAEINAHPKTCLHFTEPQIRGLQEWGDFVVEFKGKAQSRLISIVLSGIVMVFAIGILVAFALRR